MKQFISHKAAKFTESVIREMTRQANLHGAINLSQGFPDFPAPEELKQAACDAINSDNMQSLGARNAFAMPSRPRQNGIWGWRLTQTAK